MKGDVHLDEQILGLPAGCLLVATGSVGLSPPGDGSGVGYSECCLWRDLSIKPDGECFLGLDGYLHSNARLEVDGGGVISTITLNGVWEAQEILICCPPGGLVFKEDTSYVKSQEFLKIAECTGFIPGSSLDKGGGALRRRTSGVGLDIGSYSIKLVQLEPVGKSTDLAPMARWLLRQEP